MGRRDELGPDRGRSLDQATRARRLRKTLDLLEQDNFGGDPQDSGENTRGLRSAFSLDDGNEKASKKQRMSSVRIRRLMKRNLMAILEDQHSNKEQRSATASYASAAAPPSKLPRRHFCAVCGYIAPYTCCQCGTRFCSVRCKETHKETRCLKWLV